MPSISFKSPIRRFENKNSCKNNFLLGILLLKLPPKKKEQNVVENLIKVSWYLQMPIISYKEMVKISSIDDDACNWRLYILAVFFMLMASVKALPKSGETLAKFEMVRSWMKPWALIKWPAMFDTNRFLAASSKMVFQKIVAWLKLSSSPLSNR